MTKIQNEINVKQVQAQARLIFYLCYKKNTINKNTFEAYPETRNNISIRGSSLEQIVPVNKNVLDRGEGEGERAFLHAKPRS